MGTEAPGGLGEGLTGPQPLACHRFLCLLGRFWQQADPFQICLSDSRTGQPVVISALVTSPYSYATP